MKNMTRKFIMATIFTGLLQACGSGGDDSQPSGTGTANDVADIEPTQNDMQAPETAPPETVPPEVAPPETQPPEVAPPETEPQAQGSSNAGAAMTTVYSVLLGG